MYPASTFHSVYISTNDVKACVFAKGISTFHSVYISTIHHFLVDVTTQTLHSTLFILVLWLNYSSISYKHLYIPLCLY